MIDNKDNILRKLEQAAKAYYNNQELIMSDEEYDNLYSYAEEKGWVTSDSKLNDGVKTDNSTVKHTIPMLSLKKAKTYNELRKYFDDTYKLTKKGFIVEPKLDGLALSIEYKNGKPYRMSTRGTGDYGENVSYLLESTELSIIGIPTNLQTELTEVRGELLCSKDDLIYNNKNRGEDFKNERIAAAGLLKKAQLGLGYKAKLHFYAYFAYNNDKEIEIPDIFFSAKDLFPRNISFCVDNLFDVVREANNWRNDLNIPTDGVVIKPVEKITAEYTAHHPTQYIAFKYPGETKQARILSVNWGTGKSGRMTPVAVIEPVDIGGVTITNITLNNIDWYTERGIKIGSIVEITRANDVIPCIKKVIFNDENTTEIEIPKICPHCHSELKKTGAYLECSNHNCPASIENRILSYISKSLLDIDGLNQAVISVLKPKSILDIINLTIEDLKDLKYDTGISLGEIRANHIIEQIEKAKKNTRIEKWLVTLEFPNLGLQTAKVLLKEFKTIDNILNSSLDNLMEVNGIGLQTAKDIINNQDRAKEIWSELSKLITTKNIVEQNNGITFCVTGKTPLGYVNRNEYIKDMESKGYIYHSSIKSDTQYLVIDDVNSTSNKAVKAKKLGVKLVKTIEGVCY